MISDATDYPNAPDFGSAMHECRPIEAKNKSNPETDASPADIVDAEVVTDRCSGKTGRQSAALRRGTEKKRVRGYETRRRLIELHVFGGKRLMECAREMGLSYGRTHAVWHGILAEVHGSLASPEEHLRNVRTYLDVHYRRVMEVSQTLVGDAASYGAVVVAAGKALADLHGVKDEQTAQTGTTLEDVGREVRVVSPLLMDRLEQVRALGGNVTGSAAAAVGPQVKIGGVPVDGLVKDAGMAPGTVWRLLDASVCERMMHGLMRVGQRVVERAQIDGADAALESVPKVGIPGRDGTGGTK